MAEQAAGYRVIPVEGVGLVQSGQDLAQLYVDALAAHGQAFADRDVLVLPSKVASKAEGRVVELAAVTPGRRARAIARVSGRDARLCQLVLDECRKFWGLIDSGRKGAQWARRLPSAFPAGPAATAELFAREPTMLLGELPFGFVLTDAGIDSSNVEGAGRVILLPKSPNGTARAIRDGVRARTGRTIAVIVSDTDLRYNRFGSVDLAIGAWGLPTIASGFGRADLVGRPKIGGMDALTDLIAAAGSLVIGNTNEGVAGAVVRGVAYEPVDAGMELIQEPPYTFTLGVAYNIGTRLQILGCLLLDCIGL